MIWMKNLLDLDLFLELCIFHSDIFLKNKNKKITKKKRICCSQMNVRLNRFEDRNTMRDKVGHHEIINISINQKDIKLFNSYTHENTALKKTYTGGDLSELVRSH